MKFNIVYLLIWMTIILNNNYQALAQLHDKNLAKKCEALEDLKINYTHILSASIVRDDGDLPDYCRVTGYVKPAIHFEVRLPLNNWNEKFYMTGCGALCGNVNSDADHFFQGMNYGLKSNYAVSTMDGGHWGKDWQDGRWAYNNRPAEIDWAYRAVHETAQASKLVIKEFYDQPPEKSYFNGCSTGGRMAIMEAQRYPEDFDGIISGAPVKDEPAKNTYFAWVVRHNTGKDGKDIISSEDLDIIIDKVYKACDPIDGLKDGIIANPINCDPHLEDLLCEENEQKNCLSKNQLETLKALYRGPKNANEERLNPGGLTYGSEHSWEWFIGESKMVSDNAFFRMSRDFFRYLAFKEDPGPNYNLTDFDFDSGPKRMEYMANIYNPDDPDLSAFKKNGGKLIMYQGWADVPVPPQGTIEYYKRVKDHFGSLEKTRDFFRLYMIPGMGHCSLPGGPGITDGGVDFLTTLEKWVEEREQPGSLLSTKYNSEDSVEWTRAVCPYPQRAVYKGSGDIDEAVNFKCAEP